MTNLIKASENENIKVKTTQPWAYNEKRGGLSKFVKIYLKEQEMSAEFINDNLAEFTLTLYNSNIEKRDERHSLLAMLVEDVKGSSISSKTSLWKFTKGVSIILPDSNSVLTSSLMRNLIKLSSRTYTRSQFSDLVLRESSDQNQFWSGFFSELYGNSLIKRVPSIDDKSTMYAAGVACLRFELINILKLGLKNVPSNCWNPIDSTVAGDPNKKTKKYLSVFTSSYVSGSALQRSILQMVKLYFDSRKGAIAKRIVLQSFVKGATSTLALLNRHKIIKVTKGKGRKSKTSKVKSIIKPTKPSRLATIWAVERASITELAEAPWKMIENAKTKFDKLRVSERNYKDFIAEGKALIKRQWDNKQIVLNASKFRQGALIIDKNAPVSTKITKMRELSSSIEVPTKNCFKEFEQLYVTLFQKLSCKDTDGFTINSLLTFVSDKRNSKLYPITFQLCTQFCTLNSAKVDDISSVINSQENQN